MPRYRRGPTNRELRELVIAMMKETRLFANVSVRLLADLVDRHDLDVVPPAPDEIGGLNPAVLGVLDGAVDLFMVGVTIWPPPPVVLPVAAMPIRLSVGLYLRHLGALRGLGNWNASALRAAGADPVRIFHLPIAEFMTGLPRVLINSLDLHEAEIVAI